MTVKLITMGRMDLNIDDKLEKRFRKSVFEKKGMKKGNLTAAVEEAIKDWIEKSEEGEKGE